MPKRGWAKLGEWLAKATSSHDFQISSWYPGKLKVSKFYYRELFCRFLNSIRSTVSIDICLIYKFTRLPLFFVRLSKLHPSRLLCIYNAYISLWTKISYFPLFSHLHFRIGGVCCALCLALWPRWQETAKRKKNKWKQRGGGLRKKGGRKWRKTKKKWNEECRGESRDYSYSH